MKNFSRYAKGNDGFPEVVVNDPALVMFIRQELARIPGPKLENSKYLNVLCPFHQHSGRHPNLGVRIADPSRGAPLGSITCFACKEKGNWAKLADKLGLQPLPKHVTIEHMSVDRKTVSRLMGKDGKPVTMDQLVEAIGGVQVYRKWPHYQEWRGFSGKFIESMDGQELTYEGKGGNVYRHLLLPVWIDGELVGGIRCQLKARKGKPSYLNTAGEWSSAQGLFPYDHVVKMGKNYVVLVEGPRDALRLIRDGVPAMCVLGAGMMSREKALLVAEMGLDCVFLLGDGDDAGRVFNESAYDCLSELVPTKALNLPLTGVDPCGMDAAMLAKIKRTIRRVLKTLE